MNKTFKKRVFAGAVAALILAGYAPIISTTSKADNENNPSVNDIGGDTGSNAAYTVKKTLDDFSTYADDNALNAAYELFDNWDSERVQSKFGSNFNRVTDQVSCELDGGRFKFNYNLNTDKNNNYNSWGWATGWQENGAHCGFLRHEYTGGDKPDFSKYDGIELEIEGYGSENTFVIQIGYVTDLTNDDANARYRYPIFLGFSGENAGEGKKRTFKIPFDVLVRSGYDGAFDLYSSLKDVNRYSFYVNRSMDYNEFNYNDVGTKVGKADIVKSQIYIDNVSLYSNDDPNDGKYIDADDATTITYDASKKTLEGETGFDVILARKITGVTLTPAENNDFEMAEPITVDFDNDQLGFNVKLKDEDLKEKCADLPNGDYILTFQFDDKSDRNFGNDVGKETDTVNLKVTGVHTHNYSDKWKSNETHHWHECTGTVGTCDAPEKDKAPHNYDESTATVTKQPTKQENGTATVKCVDCEHEKTITIPKLPDLLNLTETQVWKIVTDPKCEVDGSGTYTDPETGAAIEVTIPATGHDWSDEWIVTDKPSDEKTGKAERKCNNNEEHKDTLTLPALDAANVYAVEHKTEPTCERKGADTYTYTTDEGKKITFDVDIDPIEHEWGEWKVTKNPTETEKGKVELVCKNDSSHTKPLDLPPLNETESWKEITSPTTPTGQKVYEWINDEPGMPSITITIKLDDPDNPDDPTVPGNPDDPTVPDNPDDPTDPDNPDDPTDPDNPDDPTDPGNPDDPTDPDNPDDPTDPGNPDDPTDPGNPDDPTDPDNPDDPTNPGNPDDPTNPGNPDESGNNSNSPDSTESSNPEDNNARPNDESTNANNSNSDGLGGFDNPETGVATVAVPSMIAAAAIVIIAKRKNKK